MVRHLKYISRVSAIPAPGFDASDIAKYISQILGLANSLLNTVGLWQSLQEGKTST